MIALPQPLTVAEIANILNASYVGNGVHSVSFIAANTDASEQSISFYNGNKSSTRGVVIAKLPQDSALATIISSQPRRSMSLFLQAVFPKQNTHAVHPTAVVDTTATIAEDVSVGPYAVIGPGVTLSAGVVVGSHATIDAECVLGQGTTVGAHSHITAKANIGSDCKIASHAVIGEDGFGYDKTQDGWQEFPQVASVNLGNRVAIGPYTVVSCGALQNTIIEDGVKIDGHCYIAHGCHIGADTIISGSTCMAGSVVIGQNCMLGGGCKIYDHITISDEVTLSGGTEIKQDVKEPGQYASSTPSMDIKTWRRYYIKLKNFAKIQTNHSKKDRYERTE